MLALLIVWLLPVLWVVGCDALERRRKGYNVSLRREVRRVVELLDWPLSLLHWLRRK